MDANGRTGRREKGGVGSKDNKILGAYGRDTLNDSPTHFLAHPKAAYCILSTGEANNVSATSRRDNVIANSYGKLRCIPTFLSISDHNIVSAPVKLLGHFARNHQLSLSAKPPVDRRRLVTDP